MHSILIPTCTTSSSANREISFSWTQIARQIFVAFVSSDYMISTGGSSSLFRTDRNPGWNSALQPRTTGSKPSDCHCALADRWEVEGGSWGRGGGGVFTLLLGKLPAVKQLAGGQASCSAGSSRSKATLAPSKRRREVDRDCGLLVGIISKRYLTNCAAC